MASTIKVDTIDTPSGAGNITISRPIVADIAVGSTLPAIDGSALTNIVHTPADNSVTGAKLNISLLAGDTMYASGTDTLAKLAKGTAGQVLTMNGGATAPSWADAGGGAWSVLSSGNLSGVSELVITGLTKTSRVNLQCVPGNDGPFMVLLSSTNGGSSYSSSYSIGNSSNGAAGAASIGQVSAGVGNATGENLHLVLDIFSPATSHHTMFGSAARHSGTNGQGYQFLAVTTCLTAQSTNAIKLYFSGGTMTGSYICTELN